MTDSQMQTIITHLNAMEQRMVDHSCKCDDLTLRVQELTMALSKLSQDVSDLKVNRIEVLDDLSRLTEELADISEQVGSIKSAQDDLVEGFPTKVEGINVFMESIMTTLSSIDSTICGSISQGVEGVVNKIGQADTAVEACNTLSNALKTELESVKDVSDEILSVSSETKSTVSNNKTEIDTLINSIKVAIPEFLSRLSTSTDELVNTLVALQEGEVNAISVTLKDIGTRIDENVEDTVRIKGQLELCTAQIPKIIDLQSKMTETWSRFIANSEGYNTLYELMVAIQGKIATSYETFIELATKATGTQFELNAGLANVVDAVGEVNKSIAQINQAVILLKDFYPNLLESQHVCEQFAMIVPSQQKFVELLESMTDKKLNNLSSLEKVEFGNMVARSVSSICDMVNTTKAVKEGGSW